MTPQKTTGLLEPMTPQNQTELLGVIMGKFFQDRLANDMNDPDFWKEAGIDQAEFAKGLQGYGARIDAAFTFSRFTDANGKELEPLESGIAGGDPEVFCASFAVENFDLGG